MSIGKIDEFKLDQQNWNTHIAKLEQYFFANNVKEESKAVILLTVVGDEMNKWVGNY